MAWRKWIVRGVVYGISGAFVLAALLYQRWTNPAAVREQIIAKLSEVFPGAQVSVDSARLRILGGIQLNGLRLMRADDPEKHEFLHVPSAIFYHDKQKILDGELTLYKIELRRPRLRVRRERDGKWNLRALLRPPEGAPTTVMPTIVIHQGTLIFEDHADQAKPASLEINDISLSLVNDPLPTVHLRGAANSAWLGQLQVQGRFQRQDREIDLSFKASQLPLTQALAARFPGHCPTALLAGLQLQALANVRGQVSYHPGQPQPWYYDVHCDLANGTVQHPQLPLPLEKVQAKLHCCDGELHLEKLTARSGMTDIEAQGIGLLPRIDQTFEVDLDLKHVKLGNELAARLPDKIRNLHEMFKPEGPTTIHIACARHEGQWVPLSSGKPSQVSLHPEEIAMEFVKFPYRLHRTIGTVDYDLISKHVEVHLIGHAGAKAVTLNGYWIGEGPQADVKLELGGGDIDIDDKLVNALPTSLQKFVESFHLSGKVNVNAEFRHEPGSTKFHNKYHVRVHDTSLCWDKFPYTLKNVSGNLDIYPDFWEFHQFQGTHGDGHVLLHGRSTPKEDQRGEQDHGLTLEITGHNVAMDDDLREALSPMPGLHKAWETFDPQGQLYFTASVKRPNSDLAQLEVDVDARGCDVRPKFFPYRLQDVRGQFRFHQNCLHIAKLRAHHDETMLAFDRGTVHIQPRGGYYADFADVQVQGLRMQEDFLEALPSKLQAAARSLRLTDPLRVDTRVVIYQPPETGMPPDVWWDGQLRMYDAKLAVGLELSKVTGKLACVGRYNGRQMAGLNGNVVLEQATLYDQTFKNVHANLQMRETAPDVLLIGLHAPIYGGDVTGQVRVDLNSTLRYEMNLTASQINIAEFGRQNLGPKSQLSGVGSARLSLTGLGNGIEALEGNGAIDIPHGHFYNLPFLFDLIKVLNPRGPDRTAFEEFHTAFAIQGPRVQFQRVDLLGNALSLSGKGDYHLQTKDLQLDVYPMWGRVEQLLPASMRPVPIIFSKNLLIVEVRGKLGGEGKALKYSLKPMPIIFDPLLLLRDRVIGQQNNAAQNPELGRGR